MLWDFFFLRKNNHIKKQKSYSWVIRSFKGINILFFISLYILFMSMIENVMNVMNFIKCFYQMKYLFLFSYIPLLM